MTRAAESGVRLTDLEPRVWYRIVYRAGERILTRTCVARDRLDLERGWMSERAVYVEPQGSVMKYRGVHIGDALISAKIFDESGEH